MMFPETSRWNPAGTQSCPLKLGQQAEASLAWTSVTADAKRRQRRCRTMLLSPEISVADVLVLSGTGDRTVASKWPDVNGSAGVAGTWGAPTGVLQEQERLVTFRVNNAALGGAAPKPPGPRSRPVDRREFGPGPAGSTNRRRHHAVPADETNEFVGRRWQGSECLHSTETRRPWLTPQRRRQTRAN
jgi:hypothetical protein